MGLLALVRDDLDESHLRPKSHLRAALVARPRPRLAVGGRSRRLVAACRRVPVRSRRRCRRSSSPPLVTCSLPSAGGHIEPLKECHTRAHIAHHERYINRDLFSRLSVPAYIFHSADLSGRAPERAQSESWSGDT